MERRTHYTKGLTLIDVVVGVSIMLIVFLGIFGAMRLQIVLVSTTKAGISALALANEQLEILRSLPYDNVGTVGGIPAGSIQQNELVTLNGIDFNRRTFIQYVDAPGDGLGAADTNSITADYKVVKVELTWDNRGVTQAFSLVSNIVPKAIETLAGGGTLTVNVFDALGAPVLNAGVRIVNTGTTTPIDVLSFTNAAGVTTFPGAPAMSDYEISVSKVGYSGAQTYAATPTNPNPNPGHVSVIAGDTTSISFAIDLVSTKTVRTSEPSRSVVWNDAFADNSKLSSMTNVQIMGGQLELLDTGNGYSETGSVISVATTSPLLMSWDEFRFDEVTPASTNILYRVYYDNAGVPVLVPDLFLPSNSSGYGASPIILSAIPTSTYPVLMVGADLSTTDTSTTPAILEWALEFTEGPIPLPNIPFTMRGQKVIGTDGGGSPIYKVNETMQTSGSGVVSTSTLEWDTYTISIDDAVTGYDVSEFCLPQPRAISPGSTVTTDIFLIPDTNHTLLVTVRDDTGNLRQGASVRLSRPGYDRTLITSTCGQVFFDAVPVGTVGGGNAYDLDISLVGYTTDNQTNVEVNGASYAQSTLLP